MAFSTQRVTSDGTLVLLDISIEYFDRSEIAVLFNGVVDVYPWAWVGTTESKISFSPAVPATVEVMLVRTTDLSAVRHLFTLGAKFTTESLDEDLTQILHIAQEARENATIEEVFHNLNMHGYRIVNISDGIDAQDAPSMAQMVVHDAQIVVYRDQAAASAAAAAASAASIDTASLLTKAGNLSGLASASAARTNLGLDNPANYPVLNQNTTGSATTATTAANLLGRAQLGQSSTATHNFTITAEAANGTMKLARGNAGATTQDILTIDAAGKVSATQGYNDVLGSGQTWQDMSGSRTSGTPVTNTSGKPIQVFVVSGGGVSTTIVVGGVTLFPTNAPADRTTYSFIVPNNTSYTVTCSGFITWAELR